MVYPVQKRPSIVNMTLGQQGNRLQATALAFRKIEALERPNRRLTLRELAEEVTTVMGPWHDILAHKLSMHRAVCSTSDGGKAEGKPSGPLPAIP